MLQKTITAALLAGFCLSTTSFLFAQATGSYLKGLVVGEDNRPLGLATIYLLDKDNKEIVKTIADSSGYFQIAPPLQDVYTLVISHMGYKEYRVQDKQSLSEDLVVVKLTGLSKSMEEVVVESKQKLVELDAGNIIYNVSKSIDAQGASAFEALKKAPGVFINNDNAITLNGKGGVLILLDGKQTYLSGQELTDLLKSMPASGIKAFEIISSPTAKYDASGSAGIINIKTAKSGIKGFSGTATTGISYGILLKQNQDLSFNYRRNNYNLFGGYSHFLGNYSYIYGSRRNQSGKTYDSFTDDTDKRKRLGARLGIDYTINKKHTVGALLTSNFVLGGGITRTSTDISLPDSSFIEQRLYAENDYYFQQTSRYNVNFNYRYDDAKGTNLNIDADFGSFKKDNSNLQSNIYSDTGATVLNKNLYRSINGIDINLKAFKIDYTINLWQGILETGAKYSTIESGNDARFFHVLTGKDSLNTRRSNVFAFKEEIISGYINYKKLTGKWTFQGGLRIENTASKGFLSFKTGNTDSVQRIPRVYTNFFPSLSVAVKLKENHSLSLAYSKRIDRPAYQDLNPFVFLLDELSFWQGNPFLQPQLTHRLLLQYVYNTSTVIGLGFSKTDQYSARITDTVERIKIAMIPKNLGVQKNLSFSLTQNIALKKWWEVSFNGSVYQLHNQISFDKYRNLDLKQAAGRISLQQRFKLPFSVSAEVTAYANSKRLIGANEIIRGTSQVDVAVQKVFLKNKGTIRLGLNDIYKGTQSNSIQTLNGFYLRSYGYYETRQVRINFTYKFADNTAKGARSRSSALENENGRIK
jgi:hypothetical protein